MHDQPNITTTPADHGFTLESITRHNCEVQLKMPAVSASLDDFEEVHSPLEDSTYDLLTDDSVLSEDDARTLSLASQSVGGETADDFSDVNESDAYTSSDEEAEHGDGHPDEVITPGLNSEATFAPANIDDSNLTVKSGSRVRPGQGRALVDYDSTDDEATCNEKAKPRTSSRGRVHKRVKMEHTSGIKALCNTVMDKAIAHPFLTTFALAAVQIALVTSISALKTTPSIPNPFVNLETIKFPPFSKEIEESQTTASAITSTASVSGFGVVSGSNIKSSATSITSSSTSASDQSSSKSAARAKVLEAEKKIKPSYANTKLSSLISNPDSCTKNAQGQHKCSLDLVITKKESGHDFLITSRRSHPWEIRFTVSATRRSRPVGFRLTKLRRATYELHFAPEDAHGDVELVLTGRDIRSKTDNREQRETLHFPSSWRDVSDDIPAQIGAGAHRLGEAASDAANKVAEMIRDDVLAPAHAVTNALTVHMTGPALERRKSSLKKKGVVALQRLDATRKDLTRFTASTSAKLRRDMPSLHVSRKLRTVSVYVLKGPAAALQRIGSPRELLNSLAEKAGAKEIDLHRPIGQTKTALKRARGNAEGLVSRLTGCRKGRGREMKRERKGRGEKTRCGRGSCR